MGRDEDQTIAYPEEFDNPPQNEPAKSPVQGPVLTTDRDWGEGGGNAPGLKVPSPSTAPLWNVSEQDFWEGPCQPEQTAPPSL